jgi:hypothetical protein
MSLKSYEKEIQLLTENQNKDKIFINNENLLQLSGTESGYEIIEAFNKDINKNTAVIKAIVNLLNNPDEISEIDIDINIIPLVKNGHLSKFLNIRNQSRLTDTIKYELYKEYFGEDNKEIINLFMKYNSKKVLQLIYDATDIFEFIKYTSHRVNTDKVAENILKEKYRRIEAWEENHYFDIYNNIYSGKIATVYMEKKDSTILKRNEETGKFEIQQNPKKLEIDEEMIELLNTNPHIHAIEIDYSRDGSLLSTKKLKEMFQEMKEFNPSVDKTFYFKIRKLGKHKATGLCYGDFNIVAIDEEEQYSLAHEWTHHIHLNGGISKEDEIKIYSTFNKYNSYQNVPENKLLYYINVKEVIARAGEVSYAIFKANFEEIFEAYQNKKEYKGEKVTSENFIKILFQNSSKNTMSWSLQEYAIQDNVYFDLSNRTPEELADFYEYFQNIFKYEKELKRDKSKEKEAKIELYAQTDNRKRKVGKRRYLKGIESYRLSDIRNILTEYKNGNITAMTKEDLLTEVIISKDFTYSTQLLNTFEDEKWSEFYTEEEITNIRERVIEELIKEGPTKSNIKIIKKLINYIPEELYKDLNIIDYELDNNIDMNILIKYYAKYKEGLLIVKQLKDNSKEELEKYLKFYKVIEMIGNTQSQISTEIENDFEIQRDASITTTTEYGDLNQILITNDNENYYLPSEEEGKGYKFQKYNTPTYLKLDIEEIIKEHKTDSNVIVLTEENNEYELQEYSRSNFSKIKFLYIDKLQRKIYAFKQKPEEIEFEIKENKAYIEGKERKDTYYSEELPSSYSDIEIIYENINDKNFKTYLKPEIELTPREVFPNGLKDILISDTIKEIEDFKTKISMIFNLFKDNKYETIINYQLLSEIKEKYGKEGIEIIEKAIFYNLLEGTEVAKSQDSLDIEVFKNFLINSGYPYKISVYDIKPLLEVFTSVDDIMKNVKEIIDFLFNKQEIFIKKMENKIKEFENKIKEFENKGDMEKRFEEYKIDINKRFLAITKNLYKTSKNKIDEILQDKIHKIWMKITNNEDTKKVSIKEIIEILSKEDFESEELNDIKEKITEKWSKSKALKTKNDLIKEFKTLLNTNIHPEYNIGEKNIFDYMDEYYTRASKEALKKNDYKYIYENMSLEKIKELYELIKKENEKQQIDIRRLSPYNNGFGYLELSLTKILEEPEKFKIKEKTEKEKTIIKELLEEEENKKITEEEIEQIITEIIKELETEIDMEQLKKINIESKFHKKRILEKFNKIIQKNDEVFNIFDKNALNKLRRIITKYEIEAQKEFRNSENLEKKQAYIKNLISIKLKTIYAELNKKQKIKDNKTKDNKTLEN